MPGVKRILMVGSGGIGLKHLRAYSSLTNAPRMAVIEPREEAQVRAAELGAEVLPTDWQSTRLSDFDGVLICAPAPMHVSMLKRCLTEGVPVLSEKPLSHTWDGVEELLELTAKASAPSGVAYTRRYIPAHEDAREMAAAGKFGRLLTARVSAGQPFYLLRPDYRQIYYARRDMGGGCTLDFASHFIDLMQFYMGPVKSSRGFQSHLALEGVEVEDTVAVSMQFENNGALGMLHVNQYQPINENIFDFCGEDACLRVLEPGLTGQVYRKGSEEWQPLELSEGDYAEGLKRQAATFLATIDGKAALHTSIADAARTLRVCLDLMESSNA